MKNTQTFSILLEEIRNKTVDLRKHGLIQRCTEDFFLQSYKELKEEIEFYRIRSSDIDDSILQSTLNTFIILKSILEKIEKRESVDETYILYLKELLNKVEAIENFDIFVVNIERDVSLYCYYHQFLNSLSFILILPKVPNYLDLNMVGLLAHETAHTNQIVQEFLNSRRSERKRIGESLADLLGFILTDSLFLHSAVYLVLHVIGLENSITTGKSHLSWMARIVVLRHLNNSIWNNDRILRNKERYFERLVEGYKRISPLEAPWIAKCIREGITRKDDFLKFKIDESILININRLTQAEVEVLGKTIQFIHKVEVSS